MTIEQTLSIIKPNAIAKNVVGDITRRFENAGLSVIGTKMIQLIHTQAEEFYSEHRSKPFFDRLISFMTSGPILVQVLEGDNAIKINREIIGDTNPSYAIINTIRADYADSLIENAVHGSDCAQSATREIRYFFARKEIFSRIF